MNNDIRVERQEDVAILHLENAPEGVMNAQLVLVIERHLDEFASLPRAARPRVVMLIGTLPGVFVRRYDVEEFFAPDGAKRDALDALPRLIARLEAMDAVTVAALNGSALGGGFELALGCDFRIACDGPSRFGLRETDVGLIPGAGGTQRLVRLLGVAKTLELVLLGRLVKPQEAMALGLVHQVLDKYVFSDEVRRFCRELALRAPLALALAKRAIRRGAEVPLQEGLRLEREAFGACTRSEDARGAVKAYAEGRRYVFRGE
jgi:enoyl-CoA hydratase/carnithine racemase